MNTRTDRACYRPKGVLTRRGRIVRDEPLHAITSYGASIEESSHAAVIDGPCKGINSVNLRSVQKAANGLNSLTKRPAPSPGASLSRSLQNSAVVNPILF